MFNKIIKFVLILMALLVFAIVSLYSCLFLKLSLFFVPIIFISLILCWYISKFFVNKLKIYLIKLRSMDKGFTGEDKNKMVEAFNTSLDYSKKYNKGNSKKLPWFIMIGHSQSEKSNLLSRANYSSSNASDSEILLSSSQYGYCWDNQDLIITELSGDIFLKKPTKESLKSWDFLLKKIKSNHKSISVKGFVIAVSVSQLRGDENELALYAVNLRKKIDYCAKVFGYKFPIYFIITKADEIQGFDSFASNLPDKITDQPFGELFNIDALLDTDLSINSWANNIIERIRAFNTISLQTNSIVMPRALLLEKQIIELQGRLVFFVNTFFKTQNLNKSDNPIFRGLFLTSANQVSTPKEIDEGSILEGMDISSCYRHNNKKLYVHDIFSKILPQDINISSKLSYRTNRIIKFKRRALIAWWSIFIFGTIYLTVSYTQTIKGLNKILISTDVISERFDDNLYTNLKLIKSMNDNLDSIKLLKKDWMLLSWSYTNSLNKAEKNYKNKYVQKFNKYVLNDLKAATIKNVEDAKNSKDNKYMGDVAEVLLQSIQIIQSKLAGLSYSDMNSININNILLNNKTDVENNGELYKKYLMWNNNKKQLQEQKATLEGLLKNLDVFNENPDWIINWANHANYNNKIKISDYWPQNYSVNDSESYIAPAYQYETSMKIIEVLSSLARESEFNQNNNNYISYFISDYAIKRDDAWEKFTSDFSPNKMTIPTKASWLSILRNNNVGSTYIDYAKAIKINFDNDDFKNKKPEWVDLTIKLEPYFESSLIISNTSGFKKSWWQVINSYINSYYISSDNNLWSYDSNILTSINKYQDDLAKTRNLVDTANDETSFKTMESLMYKDNGSDISKSLKQTSKDYQAIILQAESVWPELSVNSNSMVWNLYRNGLNVLIYGISQNTMCYINNDWSKTILNENSTIIENNNIYEWFDSDSIISKFMTKNVKPFITYDNSTNSFVSKIIDGQSLQFSDFTYNYLNSELYYKKLKSIESQISKKLKENGQNITIGTGPTSLNKDAKILPYSTTFNFICDGKAQSFTNYNTGYNFIISNDIFSCTEASININFNGTNEFTVSKKYYGNDSILQMMNAFAKDKNVIFKIQDLSGDVNVLQNYDINSIDIDINFGDLGLYDLLTEYSSYRSKMMTNIGDLQSIKIANCWDNQ